MKVRVQVEPVARASTREAAARTAHLLPLRSRPVMYLDIDDTLLRYPDGHGAKPVVADGAAEFLAWAMATHEVRWLSRWCRDGGMRDDLVDGFCRMLEVTPETVASIGGLDWRFSETKLNAIAWLEHVVLRRPFVWVEDDFGVGALERRFLAKHGFAACWRACNVSKRPRDVRDLHRALRSELAASGHG